jgi:hypothetical protein
VAYFFADSFDLYAANADMNNYWDSGVSTGFFTMGTPGRFGTSQYVNISAGNTGTMWFGKSSGVNDSVHHVVCSFRQTSALSGTNIGINFQLQDGTTAQCSICFRQDGAILLTSGNPAGTVLATYTGAVTVVNFWYGFEFEVVISNTVGSFTVRKNGNTSADFTATGLNTRGGTANNYANRMAVNSYNGVASHNLDDLIWRSDASSVPWMGDVRCYVRMPASDVSVQFSRTPTSVLSLAFPGGSSGALAANVIRFAPTLATMGGQLASLSFNSSAGVTGHVKMALYDSAGSGGGPGALLAVSSELVNPGSGLLTFPVTGGPNILRGTTYNVALWSDISITAAASNALSGSFLNLTYTTSFPSTGVGFTSAGMFIGSFGMNITSTNSGCVADPQQDGSATYVYDSNPGDADFYGLASIGIAPASVVAVTTRGYMQKSDAGGRTASVQLKSGATTVATPTLSLSASGWQWTWRNDLTNPNTGSAWTQAAVDSINVGPLVVS